MTTLRALNTTAPGNAPAGATVQIEGGTYRVGGDIRAGDHLAVDMATGLIVPFRLESETETQDQGLTSRPLGHGPSAPDPMEMTTVVNCGRAVGWSSQLGMLRCTRPREHDGECTLYRSPEVAEAPLRGLDALIPTREPAEPPREPENVGEALEAVHGRYCPRDAVTAFGDGMHDPVCRILAAALYPPLTEPVGPKLGGQRQGGARAATEAAALVAPKAGTQRNAVLAWFIHRLRDGRVSADVDRTDVDLAQLTGLSANSVRPRRVELVDAGWLEATGRTKVHNGRKHTLWTLTPAAREALR